MNKPVAAAALVAAVFASAPAQAEENWVPHLAGVTEGMADGAMPPDGVYLINVFQYSSNRRYDNYGNKTTVSTRSWVDIPVALWVPGVTVLGARYAMGIAQPVDVLQTTLKREGPTTSRFGNYSTVLIPAQLAWTLPAGFRAKASLSVYLPDGDFDPHLPIANSIGFWSFEPALGVSWFDGSGWTVNAKLSYGMNLKNGTTDYWSGEVASLDSSVTRQLGRWRLGVGGYGVVQTTDDSPPGTPAAGGNRARKAAVGLLAGYDFGRVGVDTYVNRPVLARNAMSGNEFWLRLTTGF